MSERQDQLHPKKKGVVTYFVRERPKMALKEGLSASSLVTSLTAGLPVRELLDLQAALAVTGEKLAAMLGISKATVHRQKRAGARLNSQVSDRVVRLARLLGLAAEVFGDLEDAKQWLNSPQFGLGGAVPLDYAKTEVGAREVENLLGRIEYRGLFVTLTGWRIVPAEKAATAFDGEGARLYGGRWNPAGVPMVYASAHLSLAALEVRVHIDKTRMRKLYKCFTFHFDKGLMQTFATRDLPRDWRQEPPLPALQGLGGSWAISGGSAILAVPSAIVPSEFNYLINPKHPDFATLKIDAPTDFAFDRRLFA